jgi:tRNA-dependent cyclodipeptide synthase
MELHKIRGGNIIDLENKQYNIGVGISLGNKWFTIDNITEEIGWALQNTKDFVLVYVADSIHAINLEVRKRISKERAMRLALDQGSMILLDVKNQVEKIFSKDDTNRIYYANWNNLLDESYKKKLEYLYSFYLKNEEFKKRIHELVIEYVSREERKFDDEEINKLGTYIIEELPEILCRVSFRDLIIDAYMYPSDGDLPRFVEDIQFGRIFPEIKENIIDTEPKVFLEVR